MSTQTHNVFAAIPRGAAVIAYIWLLLAPRVAGWLPQRSSAQSAPASAIVIAGDGSFEHSPRQHQRAPSTFRQADKLASKHSSHELDTHDRRVRQDDVGPFDFINPMNALYLLGVLAFVLNLFAGVKLEASTCRWKLEASTCIPFARMLCIFALCGVTLAVIVAVQVDAAITRARVDQSLGAQALDFDDRAPNLHHIWRRRNPALRELSGGSVRFSSFGKDMFKLKNSSWSELCKIDSDGDGMSNGAELGDPCCTWVPGKVAPYRVWNLSDPAEASDPIDSNSTLDAKRAAASIFMSDLRPASCEDAPDDAARASQFRTQYYLIHSQDSVAPDSLRMFKYPCFLATALLLGNWVVRKGLLRDLFGIGPRAWDHPTDLHPRKRLLIWASAYLWTDGVAGLVHLTFDFCPRTYPFFGSVATGFQYHHQHPTAWAVVPLPVMLSHSLPLMGILSASLALTQQKRCFRAFWTLTLVFFLMTVLTHRWVHMPPETNYEWFKFLQQTGLLMSHEHHMKHHDSLVQQFSNLSGVTDFILDYLCSVVPAWEYQHWLTATLLYFTLPIVAGAGSLHGESQGDQSTEHAQKEVQD